MPAFERELFFSTAEGDDANLSIIKLSAHTGTHVDAPGHFLHDAYQTGIGVESLSLDMLNGLALLVEIPPDTNITADALQALHIPEGTRRLLFKTTSSERDLLFKPAFDPSYTAMDKEGAEWLVGHTDVQLVGIDYVSIAVFEDQTGPHRVLLGEGIIPVEGLYFKGVEPGFYNLHCLPLKLIASDGAPARCVLTTL
ncbi:hypothetical protein WJX72_008411 [[Myrmecia] bisecta]|uniref:Cyclase family protein n=1 Tax=[Myrmecia] bisecta TaxID=41462 RepID=A0AAW1PES0_9CHLO